MPRDYAIRLNENMLPSTTMVVSVAFVESRISVSLTLKVNKLVVLIPEILYMDHLDLEGSEHSPGVSGNLV